VRDLDRLVATAAAAGENVGIYAARLLDEPLPWTRMRAVYRLLGLVRRYGPEPVDRACSTALALDVIVVGKIDAMLRKAPEDRVIAAPVAVNGGRFARDPGEYRRPDLTATAGLDDGVGRDRRGSDRAGRPARRGPHPDPENPETGRPEGHPAGAARPGTGPPHQPRHVPRPILSDEITRRDTHSAAIRAQNAGLHPAMRLETWTHPAGLTYRHDLLDDPAGLRFLDAGNNVLILGPVGIGKTHLATALGHIAIRRRHTAHMARADRLFTRLRGARLDNTLENELRRLARLDLLILDDFALRPLDSFALNDFYEIVVERHTRRASTIITSNREPAEWLAMAPDSLLSQAAVDRITAAAHHLILEGPSHRQRNART
jgi:hypothetical protein